MVLMNTYLNFGSGYDYKSGYLNVDNGENIRKDLNYDLNKFPYPWEDNSVNKILLIGVLEHLEYPLKVLDECHRILKKGGVVHVKVPFHAHANCWKLDHRWACSYDAFKVLYDFKKYDYVCPRKFKIVQNKLCFGKKYAVWNHILSPIFNKIPIIYDGTFLKYFFPAEELYVELMKK